MRLADRSSASRSRSSSGPLSVPVSSYSWQPRQLLLEGCGVLEGRRSLLSRGTRDSSRRLGPRWDAAPRGAFAHDAVNDTAHERRSRSRRMEPRRCTGRAGPRARAQARNLCSSPVARAGVPAGLPGPRPPATSGFHPSRSGWQVARGLLVGEEACPEGSRSRTPSNVPAPSSRRSGSPCTTSVRSWRGPTPGSLTWSATGSSADALDAAISCSGAAAGPRRARSRGRPSRWAR